MIKSKHSGWTYDLQRTPFKGGGIIESVVNAVGNAFSSVGNAISDVGNFIDKSVTQPIGKALSEVDKTVNREIPGGWITVGGAVAGGVALAYAPEVMAYAASEGVAPEIASTELGIPGIEVPAEAGGNATLNAGAPTVGAASPSGIAATQSAAGLGDLSGLSTSSVGMQGTTGAGSLSGIAGSASAAGLGDLGTGLTAEQLAAYEVANPGMSTSDILKNVNRARSVINALNSNNQSSNPQALASALQTTQAPMEQFGGLYRMNEKPFLQQQTASISPDSYNVSGQNIASPIAPTNQLLANLLYPKA